MISEYRHSYSSFALEKASTNNIRGTDRKGEASCLGTTKLHLATGKLDVVEGTGDLLLLDSNVNCSGRSGKTVKEIKAGEYLVYPRVLRPATKLVCMYQMEMGRLYSGLQDRKYQDKREYARPIED